MDVKVDVDGMIRDFMPEVLHYYKVFYDMRSNAGVEDIKDYDITKKLPLIRDMKGFFRDHAYGIFFESKPIEGAIDFLDMLADDGHNIHITSNQYRGIQHYTLSWLEEHGVPYDSVNFTKDKSLIDGDVLIDDLIHNLDNVRYGELPICFAQPWNEQYKGFRTNDYRIIHEYINNLDM